MARTTYATPAQMGHILAALMPTNALIIRLCMATGLRVSDVLELRTAQLKKRQTVREKKTGKTRRLTWPEGLYEQMLEQAGRYWVLRAGQTPGSTGSGRPCGRMSKRPRLFLRGRKRCKSVKIWGLIQPAKLPPSMPGSGAAWLLRSVC